MSFPKNRFRPSLEAMEKREVMTAHLTTAALPVSAPAPVQSHTAAPVEEITVNYEIILMAKKSNSPQDTAVAAAATASPGQDTTNPPFTVIGDVRLRRIVV
jgi:hypothetical protein